MPPIRLTTAEQALDELGPWLNRRLLLASDFDGTLSRPVLDPWRAAIIPSAQRALRRLAGNPRTHVALISGRTVPDLVARARVGGASYHGDHGAQRALAGRGFRPSAVAVEREPAAASVVAMVARLREEVPRRVAEPWLVVEDKGSAVTFHFRGAPDADRARARVRAVVDDIDGEGLLEQPGGRRAWELRPPGATTKGLTLTRLIERHQPGLVVMLGDDRHDIAAFAALHAMRDTASFAGRSIGVLSPASDVPALARHADLVFSGADVTARFLVLLARERQRLVGG